MDSNDTYAKTEFGVRDFAAALVKRIGIDGATPIVSEIERQIIPRQ